jgi:hypothetical protein
MQAVRQHTIAAFAMASAAVLAAARAGDPAAAFRPLAPGALTVVPAPVAPAGTAAAATDTVSRGDLLDITAGRADLAWKPLQSPPHTTFVERGRNREYPRDVWNLEFAFKPPRMIDVDVPVGAMKMQRKRIWYLVYRVRNAGGRRPSIDAADTARRTTQAYETPIRFVPHFVLESLEPLDDGEGLASYRAYLDRVIPTALGPIRTREAGGRELLDSAAMVAEPIGPGEERWGVATWEDVDPRIDFFSIYIRGLTNALEWRQRPGTRVSAAEPPGTALEEALRTLRLDFWRPGDDRDEVEEEMHVGFAGAFERMALGTRLLEALGIARRDAADPVAGLVALDLRWSDADMLDEAEAADLPVGTAGVSLKPLHTVIAAVAAVPDPEGRRRAVQLLFGDVGVMAFKDLAEALAAPVDAGRDAARRAALEQIGLKPQAAADVLREAGTRPLESLGTVVDALGHVQGAADRRAAASRIFGPAGRRIETLVRQVALARTLATLESIEAPAAEIAAGDARSSFDAVRPALTGLDDEARKRILDGLRPAGGPAKRAAEAGEAAGDPRQERIAALPPDEQVDAVADLVLQGLFGWRGPGLCAAAVAQEEGVDHSWVFRYEQPVLDGSAP